LSQLLPQVLGVTDRPVGVAGIARVTVKVVPPKVQSLAPLGAVQLEPEITAVPAPTPVTVPPETVATEVLLEEKFEPLPAGIEAVDICPTLMDVGLRATG